MFDLIQASLDDFLRVYRTPTEVRDFFIMFGPHEGPFIMNNTVYRVFLTHRYVIEDYNHVIHIYVRFHEIPERERRWNSIHMERLNIGRPTQRRRIAPRIGTVTRTLAGRGMYEKPLRVKRKLFPWEPIDDEHEDPTQKDSDDDIEFSGLTEADDFIRNYDEDQVVYPRTIQRTKRKLVFRQLPRRTAVRLNEQRGERVERDIDTLSPEEEYEVVYG